MSRKQRRKRSPDNPGRGRRDNPSRPSQALPCPAAPRNRYAAPAVCALLLLAVALVFGRTVWHEFVNFDDKTYVCDNPHVSQGLTKETVVWSFTSFRASNWHPLTWLSHALDCQLYGTESAAGHHLTNVILHVAVAILLFLVFWRMTGDLWPSAFMAAVFAIHPLRAESVAWVAERKDLLGGLFFMLTLAAYVAYVRRPFSLARYSLVVALFALGLMAKPMLVTVPFVLLLLDYWPLGRTASPTANDLKRLLIEKVPLVLLAVASCMVTLVAQSGAMQTLDAVPLLWRIANAPVSCVAYLIQFVCPANLAVFYPHPGDRVPTWQVAGALMVMAIITVAALAGRRRCPYLLVGWLWYIGMLVPVIGLVQVGAQAMADRYTYLTQIGVCLALTWGIADVARSWPNRRRLLAVSSLLVVAILMGHAWRQTGYWRNSDSLWRHTLDCTSDNALAHGNLGSDLADRGEDDEALEHFREAVRISPRYTTARTCLGLALGRRGQIAEAVECFEKVLSLQPDNAKAQCGLGVALGKWGQLDEAIVHFQEALKADPNYADARQDLDNVRAWREQMLRALNQRRELLRSRPDDVPLLNELAWLLATNPNESLRNGTEALELARRAERLSGGQKPAILATLAAAYANAGQFSEAIAAAQRALDLANANKDAPLADAIQVQIELYRAGMPTHETLQPAGRR
jgi:protein O-mannosyl-transferase